jgi:6-pyruvoyltetrahydropterin/6-carboxytetrahydropterin synthase
MVFVTRQVHFNAAHKMLNPAWTPEQNQAVFGPCANENWHGHNYVLEVTLSGEPGPDTGYVYDLGKLKTLIEDRVIRWVDHKNLNLDVPFLKGLIPSSENFAIAIWNQLVDHVAPATLYSVRLYETPRNFVEYRG